MLRTLKSSLAAKRLQLSIAVSSWHAPPAGAYEHVDLVNVMSYDHDGRHATLDALVVDVNRLKNAGVPTHKIVAGLPFYARGIDDRNKTATYAEIVKAHHPPADVDRVGDLYFNGPDTIRAKTRWAIDKKLAGVMIWELGQDAPGDASLLRVIESTVTTDSPRPSPPR